jgi:type II secretory pathway pseudopilin PulG
VGKWFDRNGNAVFTNMKSFTKYELIGVVIILLIVGGFTVTGLFTSLRRARDAQRMADLGSLSNALVVFREEYGFFPSSSNGKIKACKGERFDEVLSELQTLPQFDKDLFESGLRECNWGDDSFRDLVDETRDPYLASVPIDPKHKDGTTYTYLSNGRRFQIFASLEGGSEEEFYDPAVVARNISCGNFLCSVGKAYANTPLDRSIEKYEEELIEKEKADNR